MFVRKTWSIKSPGYSVNSVQYNFWAKKVEAPSKNPEKLPIMWLTGIIK